MSCPTDLLCEACGESFPQSAARVQKALKSIQNATLDGPQPVVSATAKLCWICSHLHIAAHKERHDHVEFFI